MGGGSSPPQLQNPAVTANYQQQGINIPTGQANQRGSMVNQTNPYGSLSWQQTGTDQFGDPIYSSNLQYSPTQQGLYNTQTGTQQYAGNQGLGVLQGANYAGRDPSAVIGNQSSGLTNQLMNQWLQSQAPWMTMQENQLDTKLRNQGLNPSPTASADPSTWGPYEQQMNELRQSQQMGVSGAASQFEPTAFGQALQEYQLPLQIGLTLAGYNQPQSPGSSLVQAPGLNINPANYEGDVNAYNQQQMNAWAAQQQAQASMMQGLFGAAGTLGGAAIRYSDRNLKTDIEPIGRLPNGLTVYSFTWLAGIPNPNGGWIESDQPEIGLIADEVEEIHPEAVSYDAKGYALVDYTMAVK